MVKPAQPRVAPKTLVTGVGRCGTSVFMEILDKLEILPLAAIRTWNHAARAGYEMPVPEELALYPTMKSQELEQWLNFRMPQIFKDPRLIWLLPMWERYVSFPIEHVFILTRDLYECYKSRKSAGLFQSEYYGISDAKDPSWKQWRIRKTAELADFASWLSSEDMPHTYIDFDTMRQDPHYLYKKMAEGGLDVDLLEVIKVHDEIMFKGETDSAYDAKTAQG